MFNIKTKHAHFTLDRKDRKKQLGQVKHSTVFLVFRVISVLGPCCFVFKVYSYKND
jgi:hypothetical protein